MRSNSWVAAVATTGIILGAAYMLWLYWRVAFGTSRNADAAAMPDLDLREWSLLAPIAAAVLWMGVYPESFMAPMRSDVGLLLDARRARQPAGDAHARQAREAARRRTEAMKRRGRIMMIASLATSPCPRSS